MGRHEQDAVCTGFFCFACHLDGFLGILAVDTGDDGHHIAALFSADLGNSLALGTGQAGDFAGVAVADKAFDSLAVEALDPAEIYAEFFFVDAVVVIERNGHCGEDGLESFNLSHDIISLNSFINSDFLVASAGRSSAPDVFLQSFVGDGFIIGKIWKTSIGFGRCATPCMPSAKNCILGNVSV